MDLGPKIKPGDCVMRWESVSRVVTASATVLAVLESGLLRMAFFYLPAWTKYGKDQRPDAPPGEPMLGRGWWFSTDGVSAWSVAHYQPWRGPRTLEEVLSEMEWLYGARTTSRAADVESIVAAEEARPPVMVSRRM